MSHMYTLIAYKPDSEDYCRGCLMESYSGDHKIFYGTDRDEIAQHWASLMDKNKHMARAEAEFEFSLFIDGIPCGNVDGEVCIGSETWESFTDKQDALEPAFDAIRLLAEEKLAAIEGKRSAAALAAAEKAALAKAEADKRAKEAAAAAERAEYERLAAKYGGGR